MEFQIICHRGNKFYFQPDRFFSVNDNVALFVKMQMSDDSKSANNIIHL